MDCPSLGCRVTLAVFDRHYNGGAKIIPIQDCSSKGERPDIRLLYYNTFVKQAQVESRSRGCLQPLGPHTRIGFRVWGLGFRV